MKTLLLISLIFLSAEIVSAQGASDYCPGDIGDYWVQHTDTTGGGYQPTTFRKDIEDIDLVLGEEYFRMGQRLKRDDNSDSSKWYCWLREDSSGIVLGASGGTSIVDSATIFDPPLPVLPNEIVNLGYTWEFDWPGMGGPVGDSHYDCLVESISETVDVPAGTFYDCIMIWTVITNTSGDTIETSHHYYAQGVGEVLNIGWNLWWADYELELIEYSVTSVEEDKTTEMPTRFDLQPNYPNPFNSVTTIDYHLPISNQVSIKVYNIAGQEVATLIDEFKQQGKYSVQWDAAGTSSGIYLYKIVAGDYSKVKKCIVLK